MLGTTPAQVHDKPLSAVQAANLLNVSARTIYDLSAAGRLPQHRIGCGKGALRIKRADLEAFQQAAEVEPPKSAALRYLDAPSQ